MVKIGGHTVTETQIKNGILTLVSLYILQAVGRFFIELLNQRSKYRDKDLPQPPHHWLLGHLGVMGEIVQELPADIHPQGQLPLIMDRYGLREKGICYLDLWPAGSPMVIVADPDLAHQVTQAHSLPKWKPELERVVDPIAGPRNMLTSDGPFWKFWRNVFNPGFASQHLMTLVPAIVKDCEVFCSIMEERARTGEVFNLEKATTGLTVDIIGRVVLDLELNSQREPHPLVEAFKSQVSWLPKPLDLNPFSRWNPMRPIMYRRNRRTMAKIIGDILNQRFLNQSSATNFRKRSKPVIDLALETYSQEKSGDGIKMDAEFKDIAIDQILIFLFAGHDTSSSTICYIFYLLSKHPDKMARARKELDDLLGPDPDDAAKALRENPQIIHQMHYCNAVIKETLRMFPPVSTVRSGEPGFFMKDPKTGQLYPTDGRMVWVVAYVFHHDAKYFPDPEVFRPERWFDEDIINGTWRPFERGPRNCIGQELALIEMKIVMALSLRKFDIEAQRRPPEKGVTEAYGEHVYQVLIGSAKPKAGMPSVVKLAPRVL